MYRDRVARARAARDQARSQGRWGAWLRGVIAVWRAGRPVPAVPVLASQPTDEEASWAAGAAGEQLVAGQLGQALGDKWTLLRGYRNRRGEIDHLLLGPRGRFAIEVKNQNVRIDCHGDQWWSAKYDKYGNQVTPRREMTDGRGHICTSARQILSVLNGSPVAITPAEQAGLERLIIRDHRFHAQRRSP